MATDATPGGSTLKNWAQIEWYFDSARSLSVEDWTELAVKGESAAAERTGDALSAAKDEVARELGSVDSMDAIGASIVLEIDRVEQELLEPISSAAVEAAGPLGEKYARLVPNYGLDSLQLAQVIGKSLTTLFKSGAVALALKPYLQDASFNALWAPWERRLPAESIPN
jgi:hypothetical protein